MLHLLNAITPDSAAFWIIVALGVLLIIELAVFAVLFARGRFRQQQEEDTRRLISITLNTANVKRRYKLGEEFDKTGLIVMAHYNLEPYTEQITDYDLLTPDMRIGGNIAVTITYRGQVAAYVIAVGMEGDALPAHVEEPVVAPVEEVAPVEAPAEEAVPAVEVEPVVAPVEMVDYVITVVAPEELKTLQVALFNGGNQAGEAANVVDGKATISAPAGEYIVRVYGLPDDDYEVSADLLSAEKREVTVTVDYCEDYYEAVEEDEEPLLDAEVVDYEIFVTAPEDLSALQVALFNGGNQVGEARNVVDGKATISAPAGEYLIRVYGIPDDDYEVKVELLSAEKLSANVTITYCDDYFDEYDEEEEEEVEEEPVVEEVLTVSEVIEADVAPELIEYNIIVHAPEGLPALQVALYNGDERVGAAVNVESGAATVSAEEGDYAIKLFGVPEGYEVSSGTVSATRHIGTITVTAVAPVEEAKEELAATEAAPIIIEEESFEGGILRYDRSFTARLIQSDNDIKGWYTDIKNELLSYKKVKDRMSWKRESYNCGRQPFARVAFRGDTLCIYLPLNPADFVDTKYKVEDVSDNASYKDTPCLYRIKNNKRAKCAIELIEMVAEKVETPRIERQSQDYYLPYEGIVELINKGLIKRNIKSAAEEAIFSQNQTAPQEDEETGATVEPVEIAPGVFVVSAPESSAAAEVEVIEVTPTDEKPE